MNLRQLFQRIPRDQWQLLKGRSLRRSGPCEAFDCPITSACKPLFPPSRWAHAAEHLQLPAYIAEAVVIVSDEIGEYPSCHAPQNYCELRRRLLAHCGLEDA